MEDSTYSKTKMIHFRFTSCKSPSANLSLSSLLIYAKVLTIIDRTAIKKMDLVTIRKWEQSLLKAKITMIESKIWLKNKRKTKLILNNNTQASSNRANKNCILMSTSSMTSLTWLLELLRKKNISCLINSKNHSEFMMFLVFKEFYILKEV